MTRRKEGPRAPLFYGAIAALSLVTVPSSAQTVNGSDLELCAGLETAELKLACFEALTERYRAVAPPVESASVEEDVNGEAGVAAANASSTATPSAAAPVAAATGVDATGNLPEEAGSRYLEEEETENVFVSTVTDVTQGSYRILYFHMANGQVWRQMEAQRLPYPRDREFEVEISQGAMGDYQLRVEGEGRMTRIKRVQ